MKSKKHANSFNPKLGFFLHLDDVLEWFDAEPSFYDTVRHILAGNLARFLILSSISDIGPQAKPVFQASQGGTFVLAMWPRYEKYANVESTSAKGMGNGKDE
jgi:hypothetical protein